jgi:hypothetical protein
MRERDTESNTSWVHVPIGGEEELPPGSPMSPIHDAASPTDESLWMAGHVGPHTDQQGFLHALASHMGHMDTHMAADTELQEEWEGGFSSEEGEY